jgi:HEAT repeat protein
LADFPVFLKDKLGQAAAIAVTDALHQLWAAGLTDAELTPLLAEDVTLVQQAAAAREAGERKLLATREPLEALARTGRRDVAQVAVAALGRLGDVRSVPVLVEVLDSSHGEVVDAALQALADIQLPESMNALQTAADQHVDPAVRKRAKALLEPSP